MSVFSGPDPIMGMKRRIKRMTNDATDQRLKHARPAVPVVVKVESREGNRGGGITTLNDNVLLYRRKRAPKRVRRRARRKAYSCLKTMLNEARSNTALFQAGYVSAGTAGQQTMLGICDGALFDNSPATAAQFSSLWEAAQNTYGVTPQTVSGRLFLMSMSLDYSIKCSDAEGQSTIELDVYEFVFRRDCRYLDNGGFNGWLSEQLGDEGNMPGSTVKMTTATLGVTPFDINSALSFIVIKSKRRYYISPGQTISFTRRIKYRKAPMFTAADFDYLALGETSQSYWRRGVSRGIILVHKGVPSNTTGAPSASNISANVQIRYDLKLLQTGENTNSVGT